MSEKPKLPPQECNQNTLGLARAPRPALKRKPETEVVVQLGPFTDGQITAPEMVRPLEGPTEWLIKPKTGEIVPHDAGAPPEKGVIRKYITVGAQDSDVPDDLPKISEGYVVDRVNQAPLPTIDERVNESEIKVVSYVQDRYENGSITCESPDTSVDESEDPPPLNPPPVDEEQDSDDCVDKCPSPTDCKPPIDEEDCKPCDPVDANDDCAETTKNKAVTIDVLANDKEKGSLTIDSAEAEYGKVEIKDGKLVYTPKEGFTGEDIVSYTVENECGMQDTACVYITVTGQPDYADYDTSPIDCDPRGDESSGGYPDKKMHDHEYSSKEVDETIEDKGVSADQLFDDTQSRIDNIASSKNTSWSTSCYQSALDCNSVCLPAEEAVATC